MEGGRRLVKATHDLVSPETKARQNVGEIIDDTVGVDNTKTTNNVDPNTKPEPIPRSR